jgi:tRNA pseudouridine55 synthase
VIAGAEGLLLMDKPSGLTSHDVVERCRRAYGERSVGHLGTLDPFATGLLVLLFGRATRLATFLAGEPKVYDAVVRFGVETDTDDPTGAPLRTAALPTNDAILSALPTLTGEIEQVPPAFSAKHLPGGGRAYDAARRGEPVELAPVVVRVFRWDVRTLDESAATFTITCGSGTYIRALARDLGRLAGSAAHLASLRRTRVGAFDVANAHPVAALNGPGAPPPLRMLRVCADD